MYPRPFEYLRAHSVPEAVQALQAAEGEARPLAGGQSLVPMMSLGLAAPDLLVDIGHLDLAGIERVDGHVRVGGMTCHRELELGAACASALPLAAVAARHIGNPRVRNRGTLAGSLAHADPAAELGAVALSYGGSALISGPRGERTVPLEKFFVGLFETALEHGELLTAVELEAPPPGTGHGFHEVSCRADDFASAAAAALVTMAGDGPTCARVRLAVAGAAETPVRLPEVEALMVGEAPSESLLEAAGQLVHASVRPEDDALTSSAYRRRCASVCATRALRWACSRALGGSDAA